MDGLRALAILGVLYAHFCNYESALGLLGVWLFFGLSGFLITGILLRALDHIEAGRGSLSEALRTFYLRRALRILPVYYLYLFGLVLLGSDTVRDQLWWHITFSSNFYFSLYPLTRFTPHFWSLAVEEQFYLLWPTVMLLTPRRYLFPLLIGGIAAAPLYRAVMLEFNENLASILTPGCLDSLGFGAMLAVLDGRGRDLLLKISVWSLPAPVLLALFATSGSPQVDSLARSLCALAFVFVIATAAKVRLLRDPILVNIGIVSYGAYVMHEAISRSVSVIYAAVFAHEPAHGLLFFAITAPLTILVAGLSWKLMERPINALKDRWPYQPP